MIIADLTDQGLRDGRVTLSAVRASLYSQIRDAERRVSEAEAHHNGLLKLRAFVDLMEESLNGEQQKREAALPI